MNALTNMRSTNDLDGMSIDDIIGMDMEEIKILYDANINEELTAKTRKKKLQAALRVKLDAPTIGSVRKHGIKFSTGKKVVWLGLDKLRQTIKEEGGNPDVYIKTKTSLSVSETAYKDWPANIKDKFTSLRTVKPATVTVEFYDVV